MPTSTQESTPTPGRIHSIESFGTVDGPGVRFVVFLQGCPMRCAYCHNPDTWEINAGSYISAEQIMESYERNKSFYKDGGITVTGGEPLLQLDFLTELFTLAKKDNIHMYRHLRNSIRTFQQGMDEKAGYSSGNDRFGHAGH